MSLDVWNFCQNHSGTDFCEFCIISKLNIQNVTSYPSSHLKFSSDIQYELLGSQTLRYGDYTHLSLFFS